MMNRATMLAFAMVFSRTCAFQTAFADSCPGPTFPVARTFNVGINPWSVLAGDFNRDDKLDLAGAVPVSNHVVVTDNSLRRK